MNQKHLYINQIIHLYMIFKEGELKLLFPFYLYYLIIGLSAMIFPFLVIYFRNLNFSFFQIAALFMAFSISMFLFEIPTGAFADGYSRKKSVILGFIIAGIAVVLMGLFSNYLILLLLFICVGFGMTFVSGAEEAWVIDNLDHYKRKDLHQEFFIKSQSIIAFAGIFAPIIGALIVKTSSIKPLWFVWGIGFLLGGLMLAILGEEKYKPKKVSMSKVLGETFKNSKVGLKYSLHHKTVFYLVLASIFFAMMIVDGDYWQPFLTDLGMPIYALGFVFAGVSAISAIIPFTARFFSKYKVKNVFILFISFRIILLLSVLLLYPPLFLYGIGIFILSEAFISLRHPVLEPYFQKQIPKKVRATVTSIKSMGTQLGFALGGLIIGFLADLFGVQTVIPLTGIFGLIAIYCFTRIKD
jgi:MFS family permease